MATAFTKDGEQYEPSGTAKSLAERVVQLQSTSAAVRTQPISNDLRNILNAVGKELDVYFEVTSGGQPAKGTGAPRVGSTRHDQGMAADTKAYVLRNGQKHYLDFTNPQDQALWSQIVRLAVAGGATGIGAGTDYMGSKTVHIGFGKPGTWGAGGKGANAPDWLRTAYRSGTLTPPMNIPDVGSALSVPPVPATMSSRIAALRSPAAPIPMPRPASRMPATPGAGTRMTDAEVAELYRGILPIARPGSALPVDPRLSRPPGSLPAAPKPAPIPFLGADGSVKAPPGFPPWLGYGADNRMNQQGLGALLGKPVSLTAPNPAPSFAQQFASRVASAPSTANKTVAPGAGVSQGLLQAMRAVPTAPKPLAAPGAGLTQQQMQAIRAVPPPPASSPSFANQFASRLAALPSQNAPIPATRPVAAAPIPATRPTLNAPIPASHDQMLLARTGVGGGANLGTMAPPIPATMSASLAAQRMAQPSAAPMGLSFADKFSNAVAVGAMMNGGKAAPGIGGGSALSFAPRAPSAANLYLSGGYIYQQTPNGYVKVGKAGDVPVPATQSPGLLAMRMATPSSVSSNSPLSQASGGGNPAVGGVTNSMLNSTRWTTGY
jgi:hypothetical protein